MIKALLTKSILITTLVLPTIQCFGQDSTDVETGKLPVRSTFETTSLIDNPTIMGPVAKGIQLNILHRFGTVKNGITDLYGIYAPSNIRMGLNYGITDRIMIGIGTTKDYKLQDVNWKVALIQQNRAGTIPLSVSYYGNMVIDASPKGNFGNPDRFREIHRFSYMTEIIVARKFSERISFQVAPSVAYYNAVDSTLKNINVGVSVGGRVKITDATSIIVEYDQPITKAKVKEFDAKPNVGIGFEIGTATHAFQVFVSTAKDIIGQRILVYNQNDFTKGEVMMGFNITVRF
jgi:hypothetical protein